MRPPGALLERQPWSDLVPLIREAGADPERVLEQLRRFAALVVEWNRGVSNLISPNDEARIVARHLRESIEPAPWLKDAGAARWLDFGSGAGFPAIPLAILGVGERWTLVESRRPKTLFLRKTIEKLGLERIDVYHGRLETWIHEAGSTDSIDGFTSRATLRLAPTLELAESIVRQSGSAFLWKGSRREEEVAETKPWEKLWTLEGSRTIGVENTAVVKFKRSS